MQDYLMHDCLIRALEDDVGDLNLINVIRVISGKSIIEKGPGESRHVTVEKLNKQTQKLEIEAESDSVKNIFDEEVEIDEIISSYCKKE